MSPIDDPSSNDANDASDTGAARVVPATGIEPSDINQDALRVLSRLQRSGYEAYLVGGCVRDLVLGRKPKDFDVATSAHPRQIKRLFRNGRIIGRRFRLVHVVYGQHIIETATFRGDPGQPNGADGDLLITEDNVYGTAAEDARRRDFRINGLFLDPTSWQIHDYVGGLADLEAGMLQTIGNAPVRMAEDPVRILRAIKFATRLGLRIEDRTWEAMSEFAHELLRSAPPRVMEEILRLLRSGTSLGAMRMMRACGALATLLPTIDAHLGTRDDPDPAAHDRADGFWRLLEALDADIHAGHEPDTSVLLAVLFLRVIERKVEEYGDVHALDTKALLEIASRELEPLANSARLARRIVERTRRIICHQRRFTQPSTKGFRPLLFLRHEDFLPALHLFRLRSAAWGQGWELYESWVQRYNRALEVSEEEIMRERRTRGRRRRRRRGRGLKGAEESLDGNGSGATDASEPPVSGTVAD